MSPGSTAVAEEKTVAERLKESGIDTAVVVDDAFDLPVREDYRGELIPFWERISRDPPSLAEWQSQFPEIEDEESIDDGCLQRLWAGLSANSLGVLRDPTRTLFERKLEKLQPLESLEAHLAELGIRVVKVPAGDDLPDIPLRLLFLDYFLGSSDDHLAVEAAQSVASSIRQRIERDSGYLVLMSSKESAAAHKESFRKASKLLSGMFGYMAKDNLKDKERLYFFLGLWAIGSKSRVDILKFVETIETSLQESSDRFKEMLRSLSFEDYVNIQALCLRAGGQPLGEYMLWLYKSLLAYLLHDHEQVRQQQKKLDGLAFDRFMPSEEPPSVSLAEVYRYAITEPAVSEVGAHPHSPGDTVNPYLQMGDLFFGPSDHKVLVIINAACDLEFSPTGTRTVPPDQAVIFQQGQLVSLQEPLSKNQVRTELFEYEGKVYRIIWSRGCVHAIAYREVWEWLKKNGYQRKARLSVQHTLQIQQEFVAGLARVGLPINPLHYEFGDVEFYCRGLEGTAVKVGEVSRDGAVYLGDVQLVKEKANRIHITPRCLLDLAMTLEGCLRHYGEQHAEILNQLKTAKGNEKGNLTTAKNKLETTVRQIQGLQSLSRELLPVTHKVFELPVGKKAVQLIQGVLVACCGEAPIEHPAGNWAILLNISFRFVKDSETGVKAEQTK